MRPHATHRRFEIVAQDPSVRRNGKVLTASISLPWEDLEDGPMGNAVYVVDYDASTGKMYRPASPKEIDAASAQEASGNQRTATVEMPKYPEVHAPKTLKELLADPAYHAWNVYAIVMRTLLRFEYALGRPVRWGIHGHQLKVVPHAFEEANAYYSPDYEALLFGYVRGRPHTFLCLSHDVVVHETAHALLDGLRDKFDAPSSSDQAALHEAFADIIALLSVFSLHEVVEDLLTPKPGSRNNTGHQGRLCTSMLTFEYLRDTALFGLAEEMRRFGDRRDDNIRVNALRRSVEIKPRRDILKNRKYAEEHRRGEVLVGAMMRAFLSAWVKRIKVVGEQDVSIKWVAEQGADIADLLLTMSIRAIDYTPPIHIKFGDFLSALLTADYEVRADDSRYRLRDELKTQMGKFGIVPPPTAQPDGRWKPPTYKLQREGAHLGGLQIDPTEMFRHIWNNRTLLNLNPQAFTRISSVWPCVRVSPRDGVQVRETVVQCGQYLKISAAELRQYGLRPTENPHMPPDTPVVLQGGSTLILDEYGDLKFEVSNRVPSRGSDEDLKALWQDRLDYLWRSGYLTSSANRSSRLATLHRQRSHGLQDDPKLVAVQSRFATEGWL
jgi:hypothetical protein